MPWAVAGIGAQYVIARPDPAAVQGSSLEA
jgi:hypothetical protein